MINDHQCQEFLDTMSIYFGAPEINESSIRIPVRKLHVIKGFPGFPEDKFYDRVTLVYENVLWIATQVFEYTTLDRQDFAKKYALSYGPFLKKVDGVISRFQIEGVSDALNAWVAWEIIAMSLRIEEP